MRAGPTSRIGRASRPADRQRVNYVFFISLCLIPVCRTTAANTQQPSSSQEFSGAQAETETRYLTSYSSNLFNDTRAAATTTIRPSNTLTSKTSTLSLENSASSTWPSSDDDSDDAQDASSGGRIAFAPSWSDSLINEKTATGSQGTSSAVNNMITHTAVLETAPSERKDHIIPDDSRFVAPAVSNTRSRFGITIGIIFGTILAVSLVVAGFFAVQTMRRKRSKRRRWLYQLHQDTVPLSEFAPESDFAQTVRHASTLNAL